MPYIDPEHRQELLGDLERACDWCKGRLMRDYCRQCDEFFRWCCEQAGLETRHVGHRRYLNADGTVNLSPFPELDEAIRPSFTCPVCRMTSFNLNDVANRYCGNCHAFIP